MSGGSRLDPWVNSYAARARGMTASEIRALFAVASRPEVVSLAGGMPYVSALPLDTLAETAAKLVRERGAEVLQYGSGQGDATLRSQILDVMSDVGIAAHPDDVIVTTGSQMALDLVTRVFCDPGDVVFVEAPSYVGALGVFRAYECDIVHVPMDAEGLLPDALAEAISQARAQGKKPKMIYTIPSFHNPAGVTQGAERRLQLLEVAKREGLLILERAGGGLDRQPRQGRISGDAVRPYQRPHTPAAAEQQPHDVVAYQARGTGNDTIDGRRRHWTFAAGAGGR